MARSRHGGGRIRSDSEDFFIRDYDDVDLATLNLLANSLIGEPDIRTLVSRLGFKNEKQLCERMGCEDLMGLFFTGSFFKNFARVQDKISEFRIGVY